VQRPLQPVTRPDAGCRLFACGWGLFCHRAILPD
jgi:hypothetical protein